MTAMICPATSLWMGDVAPEMDEDFIIGAFAQAGETVERVKIMHGRCSKAGFSAKYCFVEFGDPDSALRALHTLNGAYIPGTPGRRFKLNTASKDQVSPTGYSLYVGNLSGDVDDESMLAFFQLRYSSVHGAKVILNQAGKSRCFGFVRFTDDSELQRALKEMHRAVGLGTRPLKVSTATSKKAEVNFLQNDEEPPPSMDFSNPNLFQNNQEPRPLMEFSNPNFFQNNQEPQPLMDYTNPYQQFSSLGPYPVQPENEVENTFDAEYDAEAHEDPRLEMNINQESHAFVDSPENTFDPDAETLEDPGLEINISKENREFIDSSEAFFTALEMSRWQPLDSIMSEIPDE